MTTSKFDPAFNSVVFLFTLLAMFANVTSEVVEAMKLLLEVAYHYNYLLQREVPMNEELYSRALECFEVLAVLAEQRGYSANNMVPNRMTMEDMRDMLGVIVLPLLRDRTDDELLELEMTTRSGGEILIMPLDQVRLLVRLWTQAQRGEAINKDELDRFGLDFKPGSLEWESEMSRVELWESGGVDCSDEREVKLGIDPRTKPKRVEAWSKTEMDEQTVIAVATHCSSYAAGLTETTLRRKNRTEKVAGRCHGTLYAIVEDEIEHDPTATTIENEDGPLCIAEEEPSDMMLPAMSSEDGVTAEDEATEWSNGAHTVEWDMTLDITKEKEQDTVNELEEAVGWNTEESNVTWDMEEKQGPACEFNLEQQQGDDLQQSRSGQVLGSLRSEDVESPVDTALPLVIIGRTRATREMPVHVDDLFGVVQPFVSLPGGQMSANDNAGSELPIPPTPLKYDRNGCDGEIWAGHSTSQDAGASRLPAGEDSCDAMNDDGIVWSMVDIAGVAQGDVLLPEQPERKAARQYARIRRPVLGLEEAEAAYEVISPLAYRPWTQSRRDMLSETGDGPESLNRAGEPTSSGSQDLSEIQIPPTPLKHNRQDSNGGHWSEYPVDIFSRVHYYSGPENASGSYVGSYVNEAGPAPMEHEHSEFDLEAQVGYPVDNSGERENQVYAPSPPATNNAAGVIIMPMTPLKHNRHSFGFGFWTATGNASSNGPHNQAGPSRCAGLDTISGTDAPVTSTEISDSGPPAIPATPLKHNRNSFDHDLWGAPIESFTGANNQSRPLEHPEPTVETSEPETNGALVPASMDTSGTNYLEMPPTPLKHGQGNFDYQMWARTLLGNPDDTTGQGSSAFDSSISGPSTARAGPCSDIIDETANVSELSGPTTNDSNVEAGSSVSARDIPMPQTPLKHNHGESDEDLWTRRLSYRWNTQTFAESSTTRPLRIVTRKHGARDLRAASLAVEKPNTPMLANEPTEEHAINNSSDSITETEAATEDDSSIEQIDGSGTLPGLAPWVEHHKSNAIPTSSDLSLPLTPVAQEMSYPMSRMTEEYCKEMVAYWEDEVQETWKSGIALWNEEDGLPEPTLKLKQRGIVWRLGVAFGLLGR